MTSSWSNITYCPMLWYNQARNTPCVRTSAIFCLFPCVRFDERHIHGPWIVLNKEWNFTTIVSHVLIQRFLHIGNNYQIICTDFDKSSWTFFPGAYFTILCCTETYHNLVGYYTITLVFIVWISHTYMYGIALCISAHLCDIAYHL